VYGNKYNYHYMVERCIYYVNSLSDTFGEWFSDEDIDDMLTWVASFPDERFVIQTRRWQRAYNYFVSRREHEWRWDNLWLCFTVRDQREAEFGGRLLQDVPPLMKVKGLSFQPLLSEINLNRVPRPQWITASGRFIAQDEYEYDSSCLQTLCEEAYERDIPVWFHGWGKRIPGRMENGVMRDARTNFWEPVQNYVDRGLDHVRLHHRFVAMQSIYGVLYRGLPEPTIVWPAGRRSKSNYCTYINGNHMSTEILRHGSFILCGS